MSCKLRRIWWPAIVLVTLAVGTSTAQTVSPATLRESVGEVVRLRTAGGGEFQGTLLEVAPDRVELRDGEGLILEIATSEIVDVVVIDATRPKDTYYQDAAANKLIVMPTAFPMERGELHIANLEIVSVNVSYGLTRNLSLWGGLSIPGLLVNVRGSVAPSDRLGLSVGGLVVSLFIGDAHLFLPYAIASFGSENQNFTLGAGVPLLLETYQGDLTTSGAAVFAGKWVISQSASLITENWIVGSPQTQTVASGDTHRGVFISAFPALAFRIAGSRFSWDVGVTMPFVVEPYYRYVENSDPAEYLYDGYQFSWLMEDPIPLPILQLTYRIN